MTGDTTNSIPNLEDLEVWAGGINCAHGVKNDGTMYACDVDNFAVLDIRRPDGVAFEVDWAFSEINLVEKGSGGSCESASSYSNLVSQAAITNSPATQDCQAHLFDGNLATEFLLQMTDSSAYIRLDWTVPISITQVDLSTAINTDYFSDLFI